MGRAALFNGGISRVDWPYRGHRAAGSTKWKVAP
jgi:hypothetical protein